MYSDNNDSSVGSQRTQGTSQTNPGRANTSNQNADILANINTDPVVIGNSGNDEGLSSDSQRNQGGEGSRQMHSDNRDSSLGSQRTQGSGSSMNTNLDRNDRDSSRNASINTNTDSAATHRVVKDREFSSGSQSIDHNSTRSTDINTEPVVVGSSGDDEGSSSAGSQRTHQGDVGSRQMHSDNNNSSLGSQRTQGNMASRQNDLDNNSSQRDESDRSLVFNRNDQGSQTGNTNARNDTGHSQQHRSPSGFDRNDQDSSRNTSVNMNAAGSRQMNSDNNNSSLGSQGTQQGNQSILQTDSGNSKSRDSSMRVDTNNQNSTRIADINTEPVIVGGSNDEGSSSVGSQRTHQGNVDSRQMYSDNRDSSLGSQRTQGSGSSMNTNTNLDTNSNRRNLDDPRDTDLQGDRSDDGGRLAREGFHGPTGGRDSSPRDSDILVISIPNNDDTTVEDTKRALEQIHEARQKQREADRREEMQRQERTINTQLTEDEDLPIFENPMTYGATEDKGRN